MGFGGTFFHCIILAPSILTYCFLKHACACSHWDERGDRPHHRYFRFGIRDHVCENVWGQEMLIHDAGANDALALDEAAVSLHIMTSK